MTWVDIKELAIKRGAEITHAKEKTIIQFSSNFSMWCFIDDAEDHFSDLGFFAIDHSRNRIVVVQ